MDLIPQYWRMEPLGVARPTRIHDGREDGWRAWQRRRHSTDNDRFAK